MKNKNFRIIPRLDIKSNKLIKTINLEGHRIVGLPGEKIKEYYNSGADEIFLKDTFASLYNVKIEKKFFKKITKNIFIPILMGGGIKSIDDANSFFMNGADKVFINTAFCTNLNLIKQLVEIYGSQSIIGEVEIKRVKDNKWEVYNKSGREPTGLDASDWIHKLEQCGVGEVIVISIDNEGTKKGLDFNFISNFKNKLQIPLIYGGGLRNIDDLNKLKNNYDCQGITLASYLHYNIGKILDLK